MKSYYLLVFVLFLGCKSEIDFPKNNNQSHRNIGQNCQYNFDPADTNSPELFKLLQVKSLKWSADKSTFTIESSLEELSYLSYGFPILDQEKLVAGIALVTKDGKVFASINGKVTELVEANSIEDFISRSKSYQTRVWDQLLILKHDKIAFDIACLILFSEFSSLNNMCDYVGDPSPITSDDQTIGSGSNCTIAFNRAVNKATSQCGGSKKTKPRFDDAGHTEPFRGGCIAFFNFDCITN